MQHLLNHSFLNIDIVALDKEVERCSNRDIGKPNASLRNFQGGRLSLLVCSINILALQFSCQRQFNGKMPLGRRFW